MRKAIIVMEKALTVIGVIALAGASGYGIGYLGGTILDKINEREIERELKESKK